METQIVSIEVPMGSGVDVNCFADADSYGNGLNISMSEFLAFADEVGGHIKTQESLSDKRLILDYESNEIPVTLFGPLLPKVTEEVEVAAAREILRRLAERDREEARKREGASA